VGLGHEPVAEARDRPSYWDRGRSRIIFPSSGLMHPLPPDPLYHLLPRRLDRLRRPIVARSVHSIAGTLYSPPFFLPFRSALLAVGSSYGLSHPPREDLSSQYGQVCHLFDPGNRDISILLTGRMTGEKEWWFKRSIPTDLVINSRFF
jgi:hypothetical protein